MQRQLMEQSKRSNFLFKFLLQRRFYVHLSNQGIPSETSNVRGSNNCLISIFDDRIDGRIIISTS